MKRILFLFFFIKFGLFIFAQPDIKHLKHQWTFDCGNYTDEIGNAHGTPIGGAYVYNGNVILSGHNDNSDSINNWRQYIELPPSEININTYNELSLEVWYTLTDNNPTWQTAVYFGDSTNGLGSNGVFIAPARGDDVCRGAISTMNIEKPWIAESGINWDFEGENEQGEPTGIQTHAILSIDENSIYLYIDGQLIGKDTLRSGQSLSQIGNQLAIIGRSGYWNDANFNGKVHDVRIWDVAMTKEYAYFLYELGISSYIPDGNTPNPCGTPVSLKESKNSGLNVYYNGDRLEFKNGTVEDLYLYDVKGSLIYKQKNVNGSIPIMLDPGLYIIKGITQNAIFTKKISISNPY